MHRNHEPGDEVHRRKADRMEDEDDAAPKPKRTKKPGTMTNDNHVLTT